MFEYHTLHSLVSSCTPEILGGFRNFELGLQILMTTSSPLGIQKAGKGRVAALKMIQDGFPLYNFLNKGWALIELLKDNETNPILNPKP